MGIENTYDFQVFLGIKSVLCYNDQNCKIDPTHRAPALDDGAEELVLESAEDDEGRQGRGEEGDGEVGHQGGQQEDGARVDALPALLVIPGPVGRDCQKTKNWCKSKMRG